MLGPDAVEDGDTAALLVETILERDDTFELVFDWERFMETLCNMTARDDPPWDKSQWYCFNCVQCLLQSRLAQWLSTMETKG